MTTVQDAEKAALSAMQITAEQQASVPVAQAPLPQAIEQDGKAQQDTKMQVDPDVPAEGSSSKRKADEELEADASKRAKIGEQIYSAVTNVLMVENRGKHYCSEAVGRYHLDYVYITDGNTGIERIARSSWLTSQQPRRKTI